MKVPVRLVAAAVAPSLIGWAVYGFIGWNWNPSEWTQYGRASFVVTAGLFTAWAFVFERAMK